MALPVINTPTYDVIVPSTGEKVKYRPFLVREEKALLIAQQGEETDVMINTLKDIIKSCTLGKLDPEDLAIFDLEYLFTQIRSKSVGELVELVFRCKHCSDPKAKVNVEIDISKIDVIRSDNHSKKIQLTDDIGVVMKYPSIDSMKILDDTTLSEVDQIFKIICQSVDYIYSGDEVFYSKEQSPEDIEDFVNNLTQSQFEQVKQFFDTMPKLIKEVEYDCPVCKQHNSVKLEGIQNFF